MYKMEEIIISQFDYDLMLHVKKLREEKGWDTEELSLKMGLTKSFVGNVESFTQRHKYSIRHISLLAKAFGYKNISKLVNIPTPKNDMIKLTIESELNNSGRVINTILINIEPYTKSK